MFKYDLINYSIGIIKLSNFKYYSLKIFKHYFFTLQNLKFLEAPGLEEQDIPQIKREYRFEH